MYNLASMTYDEDSSAVSPKSPSTVRVSPSPSPFLAGDSLVCLGDSVGDSLPCSGDIGGPSGESPELDSDPLWNNDHAS